MSQEARPPFVQITVRCLFGAKHFIVLLEVITYINNNIPRFKISMSPVCHLQHVAIKSQNRTPDKFNWELNLLYISCHRELNCYEGIIPVLSVFITAVYTIKSSLLYLSVVWGELYYLVVARWQILVLGTINQSRLYLLPKRQTVPRYTFGLKRLQICLPNNVSKTRSS